MHAITIEKHPLDDSLYELDFAPRTGLNSESLGGATWTSAPAGLTIGAPSVSGQKTQARISGGSAGVTYRVTVKGTSTPSAYVEVQELDIAAKTSP